MSLSDIMSKPDCTDKQCGLHRPTRQNLLIAVIPVARADTAIRAVCSHITSLQMPAVTGQSLPASTTATCASIFSLLSRMMPRSWTLSSGGTNSWSLSCKG